MYRVVLWVGHINVHDIVLDDLRYDTHKSFPKQTSLHLDLYVMYLPTPSIRYDFY